MHKSTGFGSSSFTSRPPLPLWNCDGWLQVISQRPPNCGPISVRLPPRYFALEYPNALGASPGSSPAASSSQCSNSAARSLPEMAAASPRGLSASFNTPMDMDSSVPGLSYVAAQMSLLNLGTDSGRCLRRRIISPRGFSEPSFHS